MFPIIFCQWFLLFKIHFYSIRKQKVLNVIMFWSSFPNILFKNHLSRQCQLARQENKSSYFGTNLTNKFWNCKLWKFKCNCNFILISIISLKSLKRQTCLISIIRHSCTVGWLSEEAFVTNDKKSFYCCQFSDKKTF